MYCLETESCHSISACVVFLHLEGPILTWFTPCATLFELGQNLNLGVLLHWVKNRNLGHRLALTYAQATLLGQISSWCKEVKVNWAVPIDASREFCPLSSLGLRYCPFSDFSPVSERLSSRQDSIGPLGFWMVRFLHSLHILGWLGLFEFWKIYWHSHAGH